MNLKSLPIYKRPKFYGVQHRTIVINGDMCPAKVAVKSDSERPVSSVGLNKDGPWEKYEGTPIFQNPGDLVGVGHHSFFTDAQGVNRIVFHSHYSHRQFSPRTMAISTYHFEPNPAGGPDILVISPDYVRCVMD